MTAKKAAAPKKAATKKAVKKAPAKKTAAKSATAGKGRSSQSILESSGTFTPYVEKKGEEFMGPAMADHFRSILNNWKTE